MNLTSFLANKCFEFLLNTPGERNVRRDGDAAPASSKTPAAIQSCFSPPWVQSTQALRMNCDGCGSCLSSCENSILVRDKDGYPQVDFSLGPCSFCGACVESCPQDVFRREETLSPWALKARVNGGCLSRNSVLCRTCAEYCEYNAIVFSSSASTISAPEIEAERCNGCGACFAPCPVRAIAMIMINTTGSEKS